MAGAIVLSEGCSWERSSTEFASMVVGWIPFSLLAVGLRASVSSCQALSCSETALIPLLCGFSSFVTETTREKASKERNSLLL